MKELEWNEAIRLAVRCYHQANVYRFSQDIYAESLNEKGRKRSLRNIKIIILRIKYKKTLEFIGKRFDLDKESVRGIQERFRRKMRTGKFSGFQRT